MKLRQVFLKVMENVHKEHPLTGLFNDSNGLPSEIEFIYNTWNQPEIIFNRLVELEIQISYWLHEFPYFRPGEIFDFIIKGTEQRHGFSSPIRLESQLTQEEFSFHTKQGRPIDDYSFKGKPHGRITHRLQWYVIMKEAEKYPESFSSSRSVGQFYKTMGYEDFIKPYRYISKDNYVFSKLFDSASNPQSFTSPESWTEHFKLMFPLIFESN